MRIRPKVLVLLLGAAATPVAISGLWSVSISRAALERAALDHQRELAQKLAEDVEQLVQESFSTLIAATRYLPLTQLAPAERSGAMRMIYRQFDRFNLIAVIDSDGIGVGSAVYSDNPQAVPELRGHEAVIGADVERYQANVPLQAGLASGRAIGSIYESQDGNPRVVLVLRLGKPKRSKKTWALTAELSLTSIRDSLAAVGGKSRASQAFLIGGDLNVLISGSKTVPVGKPRPELAALAAIGEVVGDQVATAAGNKVVGFAPVPGLGWSIAVQQDERVAYEAVSRMRKQIAFWIGTSLIVAVMIGFMFAHGLVRPISALAKSAEALAAGRFDRIEVQSKDEIGDLARTFNQMVGEIERRDNEIRGWNVELQQRVEEKTKELNLAQDQLMESRKLAAVAELGAGAAHEINNPLGIVRGMTQIIAKRTSDQPEIVGFTATMLDACERIGAIVRQLHALSNPLSDELAERVDLNEVLEIVTQDRSADLESHGVEANLDLAQGLAPIRGNGALLRELIEELIQNATTAMPNGGKLLLGTSMVDEGAVKLVCADSGCGIPKEALSRIFEPFFTTKSNWSGTGMGLAVAHRIVTDHAGSIRAESTVDIGTTFTLTFPALPVGTQLY